MVGKGENYVRNYKIFSKRFVLVFSNFSHFYIQWKLAHEILSMFYNLQTLLQRKENNTHIAVNEKRKLRKVGLCFTTGCFIKLLKMIINHFFFNGSFYSQYFFLFHKPVYSVIFVFWYQDIAKNIRRGNWEQQIARNSKSQYLLQE